MQSSPSYRLMKSRSESDLSQPESDEEGYTLVQHSPSHTHSHSHCSVLDHAKNQGCMKRSKVKSGKLIGQKTLFSVQ